MMIRPASAIQNQSGYNTLADYCRRQRKPVFLTEDGEGDMVVMSIEHYKAYNEMLKLRAMLLDAEDDIRNGRVYAFEEVRVYMGEWRKDEQA